MIDAAIVRGDPIREELINEMVTFAFRFQEAIALSGVYYSESETMSKKAQQSRKAHWAEELAYALLRKYDHSQTTDKERINNLPSSDEAEPNEFVEGYVIYKDGDKICAVNDYDGKPDEKKAESFRTGYLIPAKKKKGYEQDT